ncbi:lytic transglycosylase domain-containing protein [Candidatus Pacearchaeota archaeon]|jgi:soluble lytic murein transglycosylase-like protein|nr:lytic transglycosylase domain-containing protein [Candidatus Pacearchaeota archaeon]
MKKKIILGLALALSLIPSANAPTKDFENERQINYNIKKEVEKRIMSPTINANLLNYKLLIKENITDSLDLETPAFRNIIERIKGEITLEQTIKKSRKFVDEFYQSTDEIKYEKERIFALIYAESEGDKNAKSGSGARGLTQILKSTWEWIEPNKDFYQYAYEPVSNINVGVKTLSWFENYCKENCPYWDNLDEEGRIKIVSACYNGGQKTLKEKNWDISKMFNETRVYSSRLLWAYNKLKKEDID